MKKFLVAFWLACLSVPAWGMDPVQYIVDHSPELQQFQAQSRWYNQLSVKATTRGRYGQTALLSEDDAALESSGNQARSTFDFTISATLPLICPKEVLDNRVKYFATLRSMRTEAAAAIAKYQALRSWITREETILQDLRNELDWIQKRVEAGLEDTKAAISKTIEIKTRIQGLESKRPELQAALESVLSLVDGEHREKLKAILQGI